MSGNYPVDSTELRERGTKGVISLGAGVIMLGLNTLLGLPLVATVAGAGLAIVGVLGIVGKTKTDKTGGIIAVVAGAALLLPPLKGIAIFILGTGALGLLAYGGWNIFKFVRGLKSKA